MSKIHSTLKYLQSQLDFTDVPPNTPLIVEVYPDSYIIEDEEPVMLGEENPIQKLMDNVQEEMCVDCLQIDYLFKDPFFVSLAKSYVEFLAVNYGPEVAISKEMATAFIKNDLTEYKIFLVSFGVEVLLTKENIDTLDVRNPYYKMVTND